MRIRFISDFSEETMHAEVSEVKYLNCRKKKTPYFNSTSSGLSFKHKGKIKNLRQTKMEGFIASRQPCGKFLSY